MPRASVYPRRSSSKPRSSRICRRTVPDRLEAALARRLDRMSRSIDRLERHVTISNEALAVFVRFWLTSTPPLPDGALPAAQAKGRERYQGFVEALGRRLARGRLLADEVVSDFDAHPPPEGARQKGA
jgi:hypothetical protein